MKKRILNRILIKNPMGFDVILEDTLDHTGYFEENIYYGMICEPYGTYVGMEKG